MPLALRPYATTGIVITGAGLLAIAPMAGSQPAVPEVQSRAVQLTAGFDEVFTTASENFTTLYNNFALAPFVGLQQVIANQSDLWQAVADGTTTVDEAFAQIQTNFDTVSSAFALSNMGLSDEAFTDVTSTVFTHTLEGLRGALVSLLPGFLPPDIDPEQVTDVLHFLSSPLSAMLIGSLGPAISPLVALGNSFTEISDALSGDTPDFEAALNGVLNIPANMIDGFLNGADLNLDALVPAINDAGVLPEGMEMTSLDFAFGGLLSTGSSGAGDQGVYTFPDGTEVTPVGGSIFNSIGLTLTGVPFIGTLDLDSNAIGPIAAQEVWQQTVGVLLGDSWDGKDATQDPPIFGLPPIGADDGGTGDMAAGALAGLGDWLSDVF